MSIPLIYQEDVAETIIVKRAQRIYHPYEERISYFCHISKNLWNQAHHLVYGYYKKHGRVPSYEELDKIMNKKSYNGYKKDGKYYEDFDNYHKLGATAQQILKVYIEAWIDYLKGIADYWKNIKNGGNKDYTGKPREPGYKKKDGEFILPFTNQQIKFRETKNGNVWMTFQKKIDGKPSKLADLKILLGNVDNLDNYLIKRLMNGKFDQVRIIPAGTGYWIEIVYDHEILKNVREIYKLDKDIVMSIDLNVDNLVAITDNIGSQPIIVKSEIWKAENQWYNKRTYELNGVCDRQKIGCLLKKDKKGRIRYLTNKTEGNTKKLQIVTENRNNFAMDSEHKVSRSIIERALDIKAGTIVFGKNPLWKQRIKIGKRNNQNFVQIPHAKIIDKTRYKGEEYGIDVIDKNEAHTSKCSFPGSESVEHHDVYMGKRIHRGLFKCSVGIDISEWICSKKKRIFDTINADANGSYNILRNVNPRFSVLDIMEGVVAHGLVPKRLSVSDLMTRSYKQLKVIKHMS